MNLYPRSLVVVLSIAASFLIFGAHLAVGQSAKSVSKKKILSEIVRSRHAGPIALLTQKNFAGDPTADFNAAVDGGDPCENAVLISIGQNVGGSINNTDCRLEDGSYADFYVFEGTQGQQVNLTMSSSSLDSYLGLANETGTFVIEDDDSGGGLTARITTTLPETGLYVIMANTALPNQGGGYVLNTSGAAPCTFSLSPTSANIPATGGVFTFSVDTPPECHWQVYVPYSYISSNSSGVGPGTVTYTVSQNGSGSTRTGYVAVSNAPLFGPYNYFEISQPSVTCEYSISPTSINMPAGGGSGSFSVIAPAGCPWSADGLYAMGTVTTGSGTGNGTIAFTVNNNNGGERIGTIRVAGLNFTINQAGRNCTYSVSPPHLVVSALGRTGEIVMNTQPGCTWGVNQHVTWIEVEQRNFSGPGRIPYRVLPQTEHQTRSGAVIIGFHADGSSQSRNVWIDQSWRFYPVPFDYDFDGSSDLSVSRPSDNFWYLQRSAAGFTGFQWGVEGDRLAPADFDGDGKTDMAVFRPSEGVWYVVMSQSQTLQAFSWGVEGDLPVPADHNGDGKADLVVYRGSDNTFYKSSTVGGPFAAVQFGVAGDKPVVGDFDADGRADVAVFRPANNNWYVLRSSGGFTALEWGEAGDIAVPADYDGDGATDEAVFRPSTGVWYAARSTGGFSAVSWGQTGDIPVAADYDGDGRADAAVFRPSESMWYLNRSTAGMTGIPFGQNGDVPTQSAFIY